MRGPGGEPGQRGDAGAPLGRHPVLQDFGVLNPSLCLRMIAHLFEIARLFPVAR